jgi:LDH2 family malate/lactate/ureidoglycolate dehydrogenase
VTTTSHPRSSAKLVEGGELSRFAREVFIACGLPWVEAMVLTDHLVWAESHGLSHLGASKIPEYVESLRTDAVSSLGGDPPVVFKQNGFMVVDAEDNLGPVVGYRVMRNLIRTARSTGVSAAVIRDVRSDCALGYLVSLGVEAMTVGLAAAYCPLQPRSGVSTEEAMSRQSFAVASPAGRHPPLLIDAASPMITAARVHDGRQRDGAPWSGVCLEPDGRLTVDPIATLDGLLTPLNSTRVFRLAPLWEVLTGVVSIGAAQATDVARALGNRQTGGVSLLLLVADPAVSVPYETFTARTDDLIDRFRRAQGTTGADLVTAAGEYSPQLQDPRSDGISLPSPLRDRLNAIATKLGIAPM